MSIDHSTVSRWSGPRRQGAVIETALHSALPLLAILALQVAFWSWLVASYPIEIKNLLGLPYETLQFLLIMLPMAMVFICVYRMVRHTRPVSPIRALIAGSRAYMGDARRLANGATVIAVLVPYMLTFAAIKTSLPIVAPFAWDATLTQWDRVLFLGSLPFEWLQPIVGYPLVTLALDVAYKLWFFVMWMALVAFAFARTVSALRTRFLVSFLLTWFLQGSILAIAFSSAGPCFYRFLEAGPDPYQPLMAYLNEASLSVQVSALEMQSYLWAGYEGTVAPLGISAAPSLHNATSLLMALAAFKVDRWLGRIMSVFAVVVFAGSIALAWHYAVDALIAYPVTLLVWFASGWFADRWEAATGESDSAARPDAGAPGKA